MSSQLKMVQLASYLPLPDANLAADTPVTQGTMLTLSRDAKSGPGLRLIANLTNEARPAPTVPADWRLLLNSDDPRFAGQARPALAPFHVLLFETP